MNAITYVNINGERLRLADLEGKHARPPISKEMLKRVDDREHAKVSDGFAVIGYSPDHWKAKDAEYARLVKAHEKEPNENKHPGTPDEFERAWLNRNKPRRARSKPYEIESAADTCAELMRKAGWLHVRVEELMKG